MRSYTAPYTTIYGVLNDWSGKPHISIVFMAIEENKVASHLVSKLLNNSCSTLYGDRIHDLIGIASVNLHKLTVSFMLTDLNALQFIEKIKLQFSSFEKQVSEIIKPMINSNTVFMSWSNLWVNQEILMINDTDELQIKRNKFISLISDKCCALFILMILLLDSCWLKPCFFTNCIMFVLNSFWFSCCSLSNIIICILNWRWLAKCSFRKSIIYKLNFCWFSCTDEIRLIISVFMERWFWWRWGSFYNKKILVLFTDMYF